MPYKAKEVLRCLERAGFRDRSHLHALERTECLADLVDFFLTDFLVTDRLLEQGCHLSDADESFPTNC